MAALNDGGRYVMANPRLADMLKSRATRAGQKTLIAFAGETWQELLALKETIEQGKVEAIIDRVYLSEQVDGAYRQWSQSEEWVLFQDIWQL